eukprot:GHVN01071104.1.p4 GENE.GHVN01071104.1~~GHVN01071104.1.p4  ORF type:complete len:108 (-),score=22.52 GHVN01071104.1:2127-2450(-)
MKLLTLLPLTSSDSTVQGSTGDPVSREPDTITPYSLHSPHQPTHYLTTTTASGEILSFKTINNLNRNTGKIMASYDNYVDNRGMHEEMISHDCACSNSHLTYPPPRP